MNALTLLLPSLLSAGSVSEVVVFPDRALVARSASVACGPRAQVSFTEVSPAADPSVVRLRCLRSRPRRCFSSVTTGAAAGASTSSMIAMGVASPRR